VIYRVHHCYNTSTRLVSGSENASSLGRVSLGKRGYENRDVNWRIVLKPGLALILVGAASSALCQNPNGEETVRVTKSGLRGKRVFELRCATCHGLDGLGGEHAPDIIRRPAVKAFTDQALATVIHDGIPGGGMPGFPSMDKEDGQAVVAYLRFLQGRSSGNTIAGDPARGRDLFFGKAGCSACHQVGGREQLAAGDLAGFARDHPEDEIRDAILKPAEGQQEVATAVARNGQKFSGMIRNEDNSSLQLQDGDGRFYLLMKSSLVSVQRETGKSMPADYGQKLSPAEIDDLVGYIQREARAAAAPSTRPRTDRDKSEEPNVKD
jgi:cytochrome c oxidase cbb3-type subunit III